MRTTFLVILEKNIEHKEMEYNFFNKKYNLKCMTFIFWNLC